MKKQHKIAISVILIVSALLFIALAAWNPCSYALIVPAFLAVVGLSYLVVAKISSKNENKSNLISVNA